MRLQKYTAKTMQDDTIFRNLKLFMAKDNNGSWLTADDTPPDLLQDGNHLSQFSGMFVMARLHRYFGPNFTPNDGDVHVLVEILSVAAFLQSSRIYLADSHEDQQQMKLYQDVAQALKSEGEVKQFVHLVHRVAAIKMHRSLSWKPYREWEEHRWRSI